MQAQPAFANKMLFDCFLNPQKPQQVSDILFKRMYSACKTLRDLQEWLTTRRTFEENYAGSLK
jgi:hypothetical protein